MISRVSILELVRIFARQKLSQNEIVNEPLNFFHAGLLTFQ